MNQYLPALVKSRKLIVNYTFQPTTLFTDFIQNSNIDVEATTTTKEDVIAMAARLSIASKVLLFNFSEEYKLFFRIIIL